jgi:hypothetical protein
MPLAARMGHLRTRPGPRDPALRYARVCYDHLAGNLAVQLFDHLTEGRLLARRDEGLGLTGKGRRHFSERGIDLAALERQRRPLCRSCLDWSERRLHLSGALGAAVLDHILQRGWAARESGSRVVRFRGGGEKSIKAWLGG